MIHHFNNHLKVKNPLQNQLVVKLQVSDCEFQNVNRDGRDELRIQVIRFRFIQMKISFIL